MLLWNVVPTHPGDERSNRRPTRAEIEAGVPFARELRPRPPRRAPSGAIAHEALGGAVRPPSVARRRGGSSARGLEELLAMTSRPAATRSCSRRGLVCLSGMVQLAVALGTVTLVAVTGDRRASSGSGRRSS